MNQNPPSISPVAAAIAIDVSAANTPLPDRLPIDLKAEAAVLKENMTFGEIHALRHPVIRSMALLSTLHCEPWTSSWRRLIKSVDVPAAGEWGRQAQTLLDQKPSGRVRRQASSSGNLFLAFAEDLVAQADEEQSEEANFVTARGVQLEGLIMDMSELVTAEFNAFLREAPLKYSPEMVLDLIDIIDFGDGKGTAFEVVHDGENTLVTFGDATLAIQGPKARESLRRTIIDRFTLGLDPEAYRSIIRAKERDD
jgi:hypothetical protein